MTGVYRAVPIRVAPNQRILKSVYKTYLDVIHIAKDQGARMKNSATSEVGLWGHSPDLHRAPFLGWLVLFLH